MNEPIIYVSHLKKNYGATKAVKDISFTVDQGALFAFLGPNGAGKSTTINMLTTLLTPDGGDAQLAGFKLGKQDAAIRMRVGVVFQESLLDKELSVADNLRLRGEFYGLRGRTFTQKLQELADLIGLNEILHRPYGSLSGGQRRRTDIARALLAEPEILFLDEPTTGLDPQSRNLVWQTVTDLRAKTGLTVFLTTHYMEEAERADDVAVIDHGKLIARGTPTELRAKYSTNHLRLSSDNLAELATKLRAKKLSFTQQNDVLVLTVDQNQARKILAEFDGAITDFEFQHGTMDDVFLNLTGTDLREGDGKTAKLDQTKREAAELNLAKEATASDPNMSKSNTKVASKTGGQNE
jgi:multidrug/hemolysin transport system ATP-binding protein